MKIKLSKEEFARLCWECAQTGSCYSCLINEFCNTDEAQNLDLLKTERLARVCDIIPEEGGAENG